MAEAKRHWNFRVLAFDSPKGVYFEIREVHYENDQPDAYGSLPAHAGDDIETEKLLKESLAWQLSKMKEAIDKPVLWAGDRWPEEYTFEKSD